MSLLTLIKSGLAFAAVGTLAAGVHVLAFGLLKAYVLPEVANLFAFLIAFGFSFTGHRLLSFRDTNTSVKVSLQRFGITSIAGFASNQLVFVLLFRGLAWSDWIALACGLVFAALQTFVLSRWWAFKR